MHFATSTNRAPRRFERGGKGEERMLRFELKLLADAAIIGLPNSGKSTLIAAISSARPKIAGYPFTTTVPNLGVVSAGIGRSFTVADIPGLIENAHKGAGLGVRFLRHIERTKLLVHLIDLSDPVNSDPVRSYRIIRRELEAYDRKLAARPEVVVLSKNDLPEVSEKAGDAEKAFRKNGLRVIKISAAAHAGTNALVREISKKLLTL
jgi:GTP-binding protein